MGIYDLVKKTRSCRRFKQDPLSQGTLRGLVDLARLSASGANRQPLKYIISHDREKNQKIFPCLAWAGYLKEWPGPKEGERPAAYIVLLCDTTIWKSADLDPGIAAQSIVLGAMEQGIGSCMIGSVDRKRLVQEFGIPPHLEIVLVIALGVPGEKVVLEDVGSDGSIRYYRDDNDVHHVPKRTLDQVIVPL